MAWQPDYVTPQELKDYLRIPDNDDDTQIALAITAASRAIDGVCNRQFGQEAAPVARVYTAEWDRIHGEYVVEIDDVMTLTGLLVKGSNDGNLTYDDSITAYRLWPFNAVKDGKPYTRIFVNGVSTVKPLTRQGLVEVTARWGWTAVPSAVKNATLIQASRFLARRESPLGVSGSPEFGNLQTVSQFVEPDVRLMLRKYKRYWAVA